MLSLCCLKLVTLQKEVNETLPHLPHHKITFIIPVLEHWLEREIVQWVHH